MLGAVVRVKIARKRLTLGTYKTSFSATGNIPDMKTLHTHHAQYSAGWCADTRDVLVTALSENV
jgi:hypothetical protein